MATQVITGAISAITGVASNIYYIEQNLLPMQIYMHDLDNILDQLDSKPKFKEKCEFKRRLKALRKKYHELIMYNRFITVRTKENEYQYFEITGVTFSNGATIKIEEDEVITVDTTQKNKKSSKTYTSETKARKEFETQIENNPDIISFKVLVYDSEQNKFDFLRPSKNRYHTFQAKDVYRGTYKPLSPLQNLPIEEVGETNTSQKNYKTYASMWNNIEYIYLSVKAVFEELRTLMSLEIPIIKSPESEVKSTDKNNACPHYKQFTQYLY